MRRSAFGAISFLVLVSCGCGSSASQLSASTSERTYAAHSFLDGRIKVPLTEGWMVAEDSSGHLSLAETADPYHRVMFSLDPYAQVQGRRVEGADASASALVRWLAANPNLRVSRKSDTLVGGHLTAKVADVRLSEEAVNDDPGCPAKACVNFLAFPPSGEGYGIAGDDAYRFLVAEFKDSGRHRLLVVSVEARDEADLRGTLRAAEHFITGARLQA